MDAYLKRKIRLKRKNRLTACFDKIAKLNEGINELIRPFLPELPLFYKVTGMWDCPDSPFGWCTYNTHDDPALDNCIFCGEPHERK